MPVLRAQDAEGDFLEPQHERDRDRRARRLARLLPPAGGAAAPRRPASTARVTVDGDALLVRRRGPSAASGVRPPRARQARAPPTGGRYVEAAVAAALAAAALAALVAFLLARAIARPVRRVAEATRALAAQATPRSVPVEGAPSWRSLAAALQRDGRRARTRARGRAGVPALGQPRAEDAADGDPRLRRGTRRGRAAAPTRRRRRSDARRGGSSGSSRDLLDLARMSQAEFSVRREPIDLRASSRARRVRRYEAAGPRRSASRSPASATAAAPAIGDADRDAPDRLEPRRERARG